MEYKISDDFEMLKQALNSLIKKEMPLDAFTNIVENEQGFSKELWKKLGQNGWLAIQGDGESFDDINLVDVMYLGESFGESLFPGPYSLTAGFVVPLLSQLELNENQQKILNDVLIGEKLIATALPHFDRTSDGIELIWPNVELTTEGIDLKLKGKIKHVQFVQHADYLLLPFTNKLGKLSVTLIDLKEPNIRVNADDSADLTRPQGSVLLDGVQVNDADIIEGQSNDHNQVVKSQLVNYLIYLNGEIVGGASEVLRRTITFVKERKQFGVPVGSFQSVKHMIADMHVAIEKARSFSNYTTTQLDKDYNKKIFNVISVRYFMTDIYKKICEDSIQLHGGMGFTWEESIHFWYKASMSHLYDIIHPSIMSEFILENLLETSIYKENTEQLEKHRA